MMQVEAEKEGQGSVQPVKHDSLRQQVAVALLQVVGGKRPMVQR